ncbi:MAG: response regulator [Candidatus Zixiibacteriota bacterium]
MNQLLTERSVLLADDDYACRESVAAYLNLLGYSVTTTEDGCQAIELLKTTDFSVMIFDLKMPALSGLDVIERLREYNRDGSVIVLTGYPAVDSAVFGLQNGVCDYIIKPVDMDRLGPAVERAYERCCRRRGMRQREGESSSGLQDVTAIGRCVKQERVRFTDQECSLGPRKDAGHS